MVHKDFSNKVIYGPATFITVVMLTCSVFALASSEKVLYSFAGGSDGTNPSSGLVVDPAGNLYGTTTEGGTGGCDNGCGTVFRVAPPLTQGGAWTETVIYSFTGGSDGVGPGASLVRDRAGNLYGTTISGGVMSDGTVFQLTPPASQGDAWTETVLYSFAGGSDGAYPISSLIFDRVGNLYGTTVFGGSRLSNGGTVFQLKPPSTQGGAWTEIVLYRFTGLNDGLDPEAGLLIDNRGALYGTTLAGTVFKLTPSTAGGTKWTLSILYQFTGGNDGSQLSYGSLIVGRNGGLLGTAKFGGSSNAGTVFQLTPESRAWTETTLHEFRNGSDGAYPFGGLVAGSNGSLLGTTSAGGQFSLGTVFKLTPPAAPGGTWTETILYDFAGGLDGSGPGATLVFGKGGALYGTTAGGGSSGNGTVFQVFP